MYRTIESSFWSDPKVRSLSPHAKLLFLYLITNDRSHVSGIYYCPKEAICVELGIPYPKLAAVVSDLIQAKLVEHDENRSIFWVKKMFRYQGRGTKNISSAAKQLTTLHNSPLIKEFCKLYKYVKPPKNDALSDTLSEVERDCSQEQEQEQEQKKEQKNTLPPPAASMRESAYDPDFEVFWNAYPKRVGKKIAEKSWLVAVKGQSLLASVGGRKNAIALILEAATLFAASPKGKGEWCPHPATWLNQNRFEDDPAEWNRTDDRSKPLSAGKQHDPHAVGNI